MQLNYDGFYKILDSRGLKPYTLEKNKIVSRGTLDKIRKCENVGLLTMGRICNYLGCGFDDVVKFDATNKANNTIRVDYQPMYDLISSKGYDGRFLLDLVGHDVNNKIITHKLIDNENLHKIAESLKCEVYDLTRPYVHPKPQTIQKASSKHRGKEIYQIDTNLHAVKRHKSIYDASKSTGINRANISSCAAGKLKTAGGYVWVMEENFDANEPDYRKK